MTLLNKYSDMMKAFGCWIDASGGCDNERAFKR